MKCKTTKRSSYTDNLPARHLSELGIPSLGQRPNRRRGIRLLLYDQCKDKAWNCVHIQIGSIPLPINHANHNITVNIINIMQLMLEEYDTYPSFTWAFKGHF